MCLPFSCGGGDKGDDGSHDLSNVHQPFRPPQQPAPPPSAYGYQYEDNGQPYKPSPMKEAYDGHHGTNLPAGGEGKIGGGGGRAAQGHMAEVINKNGGGRMADFGYSDGNVHASVGVVRGREDQSAAGKIVASNTPATQGFNKHRDLAARQAPQSMYVSASPRHHGHGSSAASHPSEASDNMKAPLQVLPMARRGPDS